MWTTIKQKLSNLWHKAWTKVWAYLQLLGASVVVVLHQFGVLYNNPDVHQALLNLGLPALAVLVLAVFGAITLLSAEH